jgi:hypothetical protein
MFFYQFGRMICVKREFNGARSSSLVQMKTMAPTHADIAVDLWSGQSLVPEKKALRR